MFDAVQFSSWTAAAEALFRQNPLVGCLLLLMVVDVGTGFLAAWTGSNISSSTTFKGMCRKGIVLLLIAAAKVMEFVVPGAPLANMGALGFCCMELFSIIENAGKAGVPLPAGLKNAFEKFREKVAREETKAPIVEVNVDNQPSRPKDRPSDVVVNVHESGAMDVVDNSIKSRVIVPAPLQGERGETGERGSKGDKGDKGDSFR